MYMINKDIDHHNKEDILETIKDPFTGERWDSLRFIWDPDNQLNYSLKYLNTANAIASTKFLRT